MPTEPRLARDVVFASSSERSTHHALYVALNCHARGEAQLSTLIAYSIDVLGNPFVGGFIGLACAAGLFFISRFSFRLVTPESSSAGLMLVALLLFGRLAFATVALWAYKSVAPSGFKPFAIAIAGGFLVMYTFELVRYAGLHRYRRPVRVHQ